MGRYLETKPADLGPCCVLFETYGRCPYGVTCRFAGAHLGPEGQNLVQSEVAQAPPVRNGLDKVLQQQLRKRQIRFERAEQALRQLGQGHLPGPIPPAAVPEGAPEQDICDTQQAPLGPGTSPSPGSPVQTCGPLTDEDVVRLRPCEKRQVCVSGCLLRTLAVWGGRRRRTHAQPRRVRAGALGLGFWWLSRSSPAETVEEGTFPTKGLVARAEAQRRKDTQLAGRGRACSRLWGEGRPCESG